MHVRPLGREEPRLTPQLQSKHNELGTNVKPDVANNFEPLKLAITFIGSCLEFAAFLSRVLSLDASTPNHYSIHPAMLTTQRLRCLGTIGLCVYSLEASGQEIGAGPFYHEFRLTLAIGDRKEALGPLFNFEEQDTQQQWAVPPLFSYTK